MADSISETAVTEIRAELGRQRLSARALGIRLGWSHAYMSRRLNGETALTLRDLERIAAELGRPLADFLVQPDRPKTASA